MSATLNPHPPVHAILCWVDDKRVYTQVPHVSGTPIVMQWDLTAGGLGLALNFLRTRYEELPTPMKNYTAPPLPIKTTRDGKPPVQTNEQREAALAILRKMGLV